MSKAAHRAFHTKFVTDHVYRSSGETFSGSEPLVGAAGISASQGGKGRVSEPARQRQCQQLSAHPTLYRIFSRIGQATEASDRLIALDVKLREPPQTVQFHHHRCRLALLGHGREHHHVPRPLPILLGDLLALALSFGWGLDISPDPLELRAIQEPLMRPPCPAVPWPSWRSSTSPPESSAPVATARSWLVVDAGRRAELSAGSEAERAAGRGEGAGRALHARDRSL